MGKRIRHDYTEAFKLEVMSYFYSHGEDRVGTHERFGIPKSTVKDWVALYSEKRKELSLQSGKEMIGLMEKRIDTLTESALRKKVEELERSLELERMRSRAFEKMIEIAEREEGISILKKGGARQ